MRVTRESLRDMILEKGSEGALKGYEVDIALVEEDRACSLPCTLPLPLSGCI